MTQLLNFVLWNPSEVAFSLGPLTIRWYSLCWLVGLLSAYLIVKWLFKREKIKDELFDPLFIYCFLGILIGARLGHCLFYEPGYFLSSRTHFIEMIVPMHKMMDGSWKFTGYEGLASHGGTLGLIVALWLYCRRTRLSMWRVVDMIAIATPLTACFIRLGNLMNSEIIGKATDVAWAFIFERVDQLPRHPGQLYEAMAYLVFFFVGLAIYKRGGRDGRSDALFVPARVGTGFFFGLCLTLIFTARLFIEMTKDVQEPWEQGMWLNMGQLLSLPFMAVGLLSMRGKLPGQQS